MAHGLQDVSKTPAEPWRLTLSPVDFAENRNTPSAQAFPTKGVHRREVSHSRTVSFDSRRLHALLPCSNRMKAQVLFKGSAFNSAEPRVGLSQRSSLGTSPGGSFLR